ncbi:MAG: hypothetical protein IT320_01840 [Anaerolineae bacterium]|nr:hypothetical protein [Anaerolineae bacterium]
MSRSISEATPLDNKAPRAHIGTGVHIAPAEWRWLILFICILVLVAYLPVIWLAIRGTGDYQFMGAFLNPQDGATYLSKMELGRNGAWLVQFQHTPEAHNGALIQVLYPFLGHLGRMTGIPNIVMLHVARLGATLFMYVALYQLGATIWTRVRARRLFFAIAVLGAGFGWLLSAPLGVTTFPDLTIPEIFPFYSSLMNVHFPLTFALLALLVGYLILASRPGAENSAEVSRLMPFASIASLGLALLYPQALVPLGGALTLFVLAAWIQTRRFPSRLFRWLLAVGLPALPLIVYYALIVDYNPAMAIWNEQNVTSAPSPLILLLGLGLPLLIAIPGIFRALRRFELDGDRLFLLWLLMMLVAIYLPLNIQRRFSVGMMIPIAYFATRAIEDVWLNYISRRRRPLVYTVIFTLMPISLLFVLAASMLPFVSSTMPGSGVMLERDYGQAFDWLRSRTDADEVVLAAPVVSMWVPAYAGSRVVYGHDYETLDAPAKKDAVLAWYAAEETADCAALIEEYDIRFVLFGPQERALGPATCIEALEPVATFNSVTIYAP